MSEQEKEQKNKEEIKVRQNLVGFFELLLKYMNSPEYQMKSWESITRFSILGLIKVVLLLLLIGGLVIITKYL